MCLILLTFGGGALIWTALIPVAERSKAMICGRSLAGIVGSNPAGDIDACLL
jgi:hypothetical protein